jgi:hypothetical protein
MESERVDRAHHLGDGIPYCPSLPDTRTIFRELIAAELRAGRLTPSRRARIVRYASQIGLSAVEAGRLVTECQDEALDHSDDTIRGFALRLANPPPRRLSLTPRVAITTGILLLIVWMLR